MIPPHKTGPVYPYFPRGIRASPPVLRTTTPRFSFDSADCPNEDRLPMRIARSVWLRQGTAILDRSRRHCVFNSDIVVL